MFNILIVEDDAAIQAYLKKIITVNKECKVYGAENGLEGLRILEKESIDAVFMDISMPVMDGLETLEAIRNNPKFRELPILMLSAVTTRSQIEKALHLKVFDYLLKPLLYHETVLRIQRFFEHLERIKGVKPHPEIAIRNKKILVIAKRKEDWKFLESSLESGLSLHLVDSALDGIELFMNEFHGVVVIDNDLNLMNEKLVAKKIKNIIIEQNGFGIKSKTSIIGMNPNAESYSGYENFDFNISKKEDLLSVLYDFYTAKIS